MVLRDLGAWIIWAVTWKEEGDNNDHEALVEYEEVTPFTT